MFNNEHEIMLEIYNHFFSKISNSIIPITLAPPSLIGTTQDDPFDNFIFQELESAFSCLEIVSSGTLTTPDIVLRDKQSGIIVGLEVKKLIQKKNGQDSRGLTIDYNSTLPCGTALIKVGEATVDIPCYYMFCLLTNDSTGIATFILMHGDFINYDFNLYKTAKSLNTSSYNHGPYGEGSVRQRAMYTYPNPLNYKLLCFFQKKIFVTKKLHAANMKLTPLIKDEIEREDIYKHKFMYSIVDNSLKGSKKQPTVTLLTDVFASCKNRSPRNRTASMPRLES